jgi:hypothetical protein
MARKAANLECLASSNLIIFLSPDGKPKTFHSVPVVEISNFFGHYLELRERVWLPSSVTISGSENLISPIYKIECKFKIYLGR